MNQCAVRGKKLYHDGVEGREPDDLGYSPHEAAIPEGLPLKVNIRLPASVSSPITLNYSVCEHCGCLFLNEP